MRLINIEKQKSFNFHEMIPLIKSMKKELENEKFFTKKLTCLANFQTYLIVSFFFPLVILLGKDERDKGFHIKRTERVLEGV